MCQTMKETAKLRGKEEKQSVSYTLQNFVVFGKIGTWRILRTDMAIGTKAGGFIKDANAKAICNAYYKGEIPFIAFKDFFNGKDVLELVN
jgi:hypothetical protein